MMNKRMAAASLTVGMLSMLLSIMIYILVEFACIFGSAQHTILEMIPLFAGLPLTIIGIAFGGDKK